MRLKTIILILIFVLVFSYAFVKLNSGLGDKITGAIVAGAGLLLSRPKLGLGIMIIIILSIIGYYNRERIEKIIERIRERRSEKL